MINPGSDIISVVLRGSSEPVNAAHIIHFFSVWVRVQSQNLLDGWVQFQAKQVIGRCGSAHVHWEPVEVKPSCLELRGGDDALANPAGAKPLKLLVDKPKGLILF